jgi:hypothetical protein
MTTWAEFATVAPRLAAEGRRLIYQRGDGEALLATVREGEPPRIHPVNVAIVGSGLYAFILGSPKRRDLERDGRYALHTHQDPAAPSEFQVRGRSRRVDDPAERAAVASGWAFDVDDSYALFEFLVESALLGERESPDAWPPRYTSWAAGGGGTAPASGGGTAPAGGGSG